MTDSEFLGQLRRSTAQLSMANRIAPDPWRELVAGLYDALVALEALVEDQEGA